MVAPARCLFEAQEYPDDAWDWIYDINVRCTLVPTQAAVKAMIRRRPGRQGPQHQLGACRARHPGRLLGVLAAKGAISSLTRQWATEWAKYGINVNAISPTFVDTPQVAMLLDDPAFKKSLTDRIPIGRVGGTADLVGAAIFLSRMPARSSR